VITTRVVVERLDAMGVPTPYVTYDNASQIQDLALEDAPGHSHMVFGAANLRCSEADLNATPTLSPFTIATDCGDAHGGSGVGDSMFAAYVTASGAVRLAWDNVPFDIELSSAGHAPKATVDGTSFWVAWLDTRSGSDRLTLAKIDTAGNATSVDLGALTPLDAESFELIGDGAATRLVVAEPGRIAAVQPCL